jgi:hypothetical protein
MWFSAEQLYTPSLGKLINGNRSYVEKELEELLIDEFENSGEDELCYTAKNLVDMLKRNNVLAQSNYIVKLLKEKYKLKPVNSSYKYYRTEFKSPENINGINFTTEKGRYYTFKRENFVFAVEVLKTANNFQ